MKGVSMYKVWKFEYEEVKEKPGLYKRVIKVISEGTDFNGAKELRKYDKEVQISRI
jgi:hypothetical protein